MFSSEMFIRSIQEIFEGYKRSKEKDIRKHDELTMWRRKFLENYPFADKEQRKGYIHQVFLSLPTGCFIDKTPEEIIHGLLNPPVDEILKNSSMIHMG
jgi:hypothetical protein